MEDVEAAEATPEWETDRVSAARGENISISKTDLKVRGWSPSMMDKLLGEPDYVIPLRQNRVMHKYRVSRVSAAESSDVFRDLRTAAAARSSRGRAASDKRAGAVRAAVTVIAEQLVVSPPPTLDALRTRALRAQQEWYDSGERGDSVEGADYSTVERWCENYLRHECSNYDELLEHVESEFRGQPGVRELYSSIVRPVVDRKVDEVMYALHNPNKDSGG